MSDRRATRVAVLGAGIMGCSVALYLARAGFAVTLFDKAPSPMNGASRWNEGKIHLGFLYAADPSMSTAARLIPGGLAFKGLLEELLGTSVAPAVAEEDDIYLVHPDSVVGAEAMANYHQRVHRLIASSGCSCGYLAPIGRVERLTRVALEALSPCPLRAGFRVPERSIRTHWVADRFVEAVRAEPLISLLTGTTVSGVVPVSGSCDGSWSVSSDPGVGGEFGIVVNALWEGRLSVDIAAGVQPEPGWSHRFRLSLFVRTGEWTAPPSVTFATGPFGDVKSYPGRHYYLSWYSAGLLADTGEVAPPEVELPSTDRFIASVRRGFAGTFPRAAEIIDHAEEMTVGGGWVFALGDGSLSDITASLHRRDRFGVRRIGTYFSVDTGKYSTAPWLARRIADEIIGR